MRVPFSHTSATYTTPSKSSSVRLLLSLSSGVKRLRYHPAPISLNPLAESRLLMLAAASLVSACSSAAGAIQGCPIWKS